MAQPSSAEQIGILSIKPRTPRGPFQQYVLGAQAVTSQKIVKDSYWASPACAWNERSFAYISGTQQGPASVARQG
jgi:hypothetical protein